MYVASDCVERWGRARRGLLLLAAGLALAVLTSSCALLGDDGDEGLRQSLRSNQFVWNQADLSNYIYDYRYGSAWGGPPPVTITVRADTVHAVVNRETGEPLDEAEHDFFPTVDELFDELHEALDYDQADVIFDAELGYPHRASFDPYRNAEDDAFSYEAEGLEADE